MNTLTNPLIEYGNDTTIYLSSYTHYSGQIAEKAISELRDVELQELPSFIYQLLLLATKVRFLGCRSSCQGGGAHLFHFREADDRW